MWWLCFSLLLGGGYVLLLMEFWRTWQKIPIAHPPPEFLPENATPVSVMVPARNEAGHIATCLDALLRQTYPAAALQIIVLDDFSTDETAAIVRSYADRGVQLFSLASFFPEPKGAHKKKALALGVEQARGELVLTTDADSRVPPTWVAAAVAAYQQGAVAITGPVVFQNENNRFERFQSLDILGTMVITGAGLYSGHLLLANGANFAYSRQAFDAVDGFAGIDRQASGDDVLLMQKLAAAYPGRMRFLKGADYQVASYPESTLADFWQQRLRWASKTGSYARPYILMVYAFTALWCWVILLTPLQAIAIGPPAFALTLLLWGIKSGTDFLFLRAAARFFGRTDLLQSFAYAEVAHTLYIAAISVATFFQKSYRWKGRKVR